MIDTAQRGVSAWTINFAAARSRARLLPAGLSIALSLASGLPALAADVSIDDITTVDKGTTTVIKRVDVTNTNLDKAEILKLFQGSTKPEESAAILRRLKASSFSMPSIEMTGKDGFKGTIRNFVATDISEGRVAKIEIGGFDGKSVSEGTVVKVASAVLDNADLSKLLDAAKDKLKPDANAASQAVEHMLVSGIDVLVPADGVERTAAGGNLNHFALAAIEGTNDKGVRPKLKTVVEIRHFLFEPVKGSSEAESIAELGYSKLDLGLKVNGTFDQSAKRLLIEEFTFSGLDMGAFGMKADLGNYVQPGTGAPDTAQQQALMESTLSSVQLSFVNSGLFDKAVAILSQRQGKTPDAMKAEWSAIAGAMLPVMLGGDPAAKVIGDAVTAFIAKPQNITIGATTKGAPVKIMDLGTMKSPADVLSRINVTASANK